MSAFTPSTTFDGVRPGLALNGQDDGALVVIQAMTLLLSTLSMTLATSSKRTGDPFFHVTMMGR